MSNKYAILESVGGGVQRVNDYADLERHHPSRGNEPGRVYGTVNGEREELLGNYGGRATVSADGDYFVSKDFVLKVGNSASVQVPAVANGYIGRIDPANGIVQIYDKPANDPSREMIAQYRHLDLRNTPLREGQAIEYGEPIGIQSGFNKGNPSAFGKHVHIDINTGYLPQMDRYLRDMDSGALTPDRRPANSPNRTGEATVSDVSGRGTQTHNPGGGGRPAEPAMADGVLRKNERGPEVQALQERLNQLGYRDAEGKPLVADGKFGDRTQQAVEAFQRDRGLEVDGIAGPRTLGAIRLDGPERERAGEPRLSDPAHRDHPIYQQAVGALEKLGPQAFNSRQDLERAAATTAYEARVSGLTSIDHIVPNANGNGLFAVQGDLQDPGHRRVYVDKQQAVGQSIEQSTQKLQQDVPPPAQTVDQPQQQQQNARTMVA